MDQSKQLFKPSASATQLLTLQSKPVKLTPLVASALPMHSMHPLWPKVLAYLLVVGPIIIASTRVIIAFVHFIKSELLPMPSLHRLLFAKLHFD